MSRIRGRDTGPELLLRQALRSAGLRGYRLHVQGIPGRPDVVFRRQRVAVFVDGAFWHGHPSAFREGKSGEFWDRKIAENRARDRRYDESLRASGWHVLRLWDFEIERDAEACVQRVAALFGHARLDAQHLPQADDVEEQPVVRAAIRPSKSPADITAERKRKGSRLRTR